jgi:ribosomal protein L4
MIEALELRGPWLLVVRGADENTWKSARNVEGLTLARAARVNAYDLLKHRTVIFTKGSLQLVRDRIGVNPKEAAHA